MKIGRIWLPVLAFCIPFSLQATKPSPWQSTSVDALKAIDDDLSRNSRTSGFFDGIDVSEYRFGENGFDWHLIRFANSEAPDGPLWIVPHDDENAAFDAMIAAIKQHGGIGIAVNSGPGSLRRQTGRGTCGVRGGNVSSCDPNRNFDARTPMFTSAFLAQRTNGQPLIALHTNGAGASGDFSLLDLNAYKKGRVQLRVGAYRGRNPIPQMDNYDTLGLIAYAASDGKPGDAAIACQRALNSAGIHFWYEKVSKSDGSLSNYLALERPDIAYFNAESREEADLSLSAARHSIMIEAYLAKCKPSRNQPAP